MAIKAQETQLNVVPGGIIPVVHVSQYDVGRTLTFILYDGNTAATLSTGTTAVIEGTKPDGHGFQYSATVSGNEVTVNTTQQMTIITGTVDCKIVLTKGSQVIGTALFIMDVEKAGINESTDISETEIPLIIQLATEQMLTAEAWAKGTMNGVPVEEGQPGYNDSSLFWAGQSQETYFRVLSLLSLATFTVDFQTGELIYTMNEVYSFEINTTTGNLEWEVILE